ncbi:MAG: hypothetical protein FD143_3574 [Ignavibacteria bacterium]|nr:MAG: hypothetical protein FD143_3574 [Ignavibacteria bacterium]KAF0152718.1 MAG: hypothetical protein FD188_3397 [Ignavibacteria bacterium]
MVTVIKKGMREKEINSLLIKHGNKKKKKIDLKKYCGIIQLKEDPIKLQKELRDEWE